MTLKSEKPKCVFIGCVCFFFFLLLPEQLFDSLVSENMGILFAAHVFSFLTPIQLQFSLVHLNRLNFLVTYLFSVAMF